MEALVKMDRAERFEIEGPATLRLRPDLPVTVTVVNLSRTGCLLRAPGRIRVGSTISIGIPGIGARAARVSRIGDDGCGCAFLTPLNAGDITRALAAAGVGDAAASGIVRQLRRRQQTAEPAPHRTSAQRMADRIRADAKHWIGTMRYRR